MFLCFCGDKCRCCTYRILACVSPSLSVLVLLIYFLFLRCFLFLLLFRDHSALNMSCVPRIVSFNHAWPSSPNLLFLYICFPPTRTPRPIVTSAVLACLLPAHPSLIMFARTHPHQYMFTMVMNAPPLPSTEFMSRFTYFTMS